MKFCEYCGNELSPLAAACPRCGHPTSAPAQTEPVHAQWWQRVVAHLIDGVILLVPFSIVLVAMIGPRIDPTTTTTTLEPAVEEAILRLSLIAAGVGGLYKFLLEGARGQTVGKMAMRLHVRSVDGAPISYGQAFARWLLFAVMSWFVVPVIVDALWPLWDPRRQALHDKPARTIVVHTP